MNTTMRLQVLASIIALALPFQDLNAQNISKVDPDQVTIVRDDWGVPHIYAPSDAGAAYGLAWAHSEDDFPTIQYNLLMGQGRLGELTGKEGAIRDYLFHLTRVEERIEEKYDSVFSTEFKAYLQGYVDGLNAYAKAHPEEVLVRGSFPARPEEVIQSYMMMNTFMTKAHLEFQKILEGAYDQDFENFGSNAFAFNSAMTGADETYLTINPHLPLEGQFSWYEAHLNSEEGLNILGAMFPLGCSVFLGSNEHLGWAHTFNGLDLTDVYRLKMHPKKNNTYLFDGEWLKLEVKVIQMKVRVNEMLSVPVWKKVYWSKHGPVLKSEEGVYAIRYPALFEIGSAEQWYKMNKATDHHSFMEAINMGRMLRFNVVYADENDTIMYLNNGLIPKRAEGFDFSTVLAGNTSANIWDEYYKVDELPSVVNPECGYVMNTNNSPFSASCEGQSPTADHFAEDMGFRFYENNRSIRFFELMNAMEDVDFSSFKKMKWDLHLPDESEFVASFEEMIALNPDEFPEIQPSLEILKNWDRTGNKDSEGGAVFLLTMDYLYNKLDIGENFFVRGFRAAQSLYVEALINAQDHLMQYFNTMNVALGELQQHTRGEKSLPLWGLPDMLAPNYPEESKNGKFKCYVGDSYVQFARFTEDGVEIESLHPFGASNRPDSDHYTDQMELYVNQQTKKMTLDRDEVFNSAEEIYHPE